MMERGICRLIYVGDIQLPEKVHRTPLIYEVASVHQRMRPESQERERARVCSADTSVNYDAPGITNALLLVLMVIINKIPTMGS